MESRVESLTKFAAANHGLFRREDATARGLTASFLQRQVVRGWCVRVAPKTFRICGAPRTPDQDLLAAIWFHEGPADASHRGAARLLGLPGYGSARPEVTRLHEHFRGAGIGLVHGSLILPPQHLTIVRNISVTTVARTAFDLAGVESVQRVERTLDHALSRRLCTLGDVHQVFFALARRGRRGTAAMRALLEERGVGFVPPASELERRARRLFASAGLPEPAFEVDLGDAEWIGRVDCVWRSARVIVELDGRRYHDGRTTLDDDRRRDNRLMAAGWRVIRITWDDVVNRPGEVIATIRAALNSHPNTNLVDR